MSYSLKRLTKERNNSVLIFNHIKQFVVRFNTLCTQRGEMLVLFILIVQYYPYFIYYLCMIFSPLRSPLCIQHTRIL